VTEDVAISTEEHFTTLTENTLISNWCT